MSAPEQRPREAPALVVVVPLEGPPRLHVTAESDLDAARLREDLLSRPDLPAELADLVDRGVPEIRSRRGAA